KKVKALAEDRDLNPTAYTRLAALGNRIKPTVVYNTDEHTEQLKKEKQTLEMALETSVPKEDSELLEAQCESYKTYIRSEEHTSELQSRFDLVCRLLLEKKKYS